MENLKEDSILKKLIKPIHFNIYDYDNTIFYTGNTYSEYSVSIFGEKEFKTIRNLWLIPCGKSYFYRHSELQNDYQSIYIKGLLTNLISMEKKGILINEKIELIKKIFYEADNQFQSIKTLEDIKSITDKNKEICILIYNMEKFKKLTNELKKEKIFDLSIEEINNIIMTEDNLKLWLSNTINVLKKIKEKINLYKNNTEKSKLSIDCSNITELNEIENTINELSNKNYDIKNIYKFYDDIFFKVAALKEVLLDNCEINEILINKLSESYNDNRINKINSLKDYRVVYDIFQIIYKYSKNLKYKKACENLLKEKNGDNNIIGGTKNFVKRDSTKLIDILNQSKTIDDIIDCLEVKIKIIENLINKINDKNIYEEKLKYFKNCLKQYKNSKDLNKLINDENIIKFKVIGDNFKVESGSDLDVYLNLYKCLNDNQLKEKNINKDIYNAYLNISVSLSIENIFLFNEETKEKIKLNELKNEIINEIRKGLKNRYSFCTNNNDVFKKLKITIKEDKNKFNLFKEI